MSKTKRVARVAAAAILAAAICSTAGAAFSSTQAGVGGSPGRQQAGFTTSPGRHLAGVSSSPGARYHALNGRKAGRGQQEYLLAWNMTGPCSCR